MIALTSWSTSCIGIIDTLAHSALDDLQVFPNGTIEILAFIDSTEIR